MTTCIGNAAGSKPADGRAAKDAPVGSRSDVTLTLGVVARMFKVSTLTLRFYELLGLVRRQWIGRDLVYSWIDCERIALIVKARRAGLGLRAIKPVTVAMDSDASAHAVDARTPLADLDAGLGTCQRLIHDLEVRQHAIANALGELYRIEWEFLDRLGVKTGRPTDNPDPRN